MAELSVLIKQLLDTYPPGERATRKRIFEEMATRPNGQASLRTLHGARVPPELPPPERPRVPRPTKLGEPSGPGDVGLGPGGGGGPPLNPPPAAPLPATAASVPSGGFNLGNLLFPAGKLPFGLGAATGAIATEEAGKAGLFGLPSNPFGRPAPNQPTTEEPPPEGETGGETPTPSSTPLVPPTFDEVQENPKLLRDFVIRGLQSFDRLRNKRAIEPSEVEDIYRAYGVELPMTEKEKRGLAVAEGQLGVAKGQLGVEQGRLDLANKTHQKDLQEALLKAFNDVMGRNIALPPGAAFVPGFEPGGEGSRLTGVTLPAGPPVDMTPFDEAIQRLTAMSGAQ